MIEGVVFLCVGVALLHVGSGLMAGAEEQMSWWTRYRRNSAAFWGVTDSPRPERGARYRGTWALLIGIAFIVGGLSLLF